MRHIIGTFVLSSLLCLAGSPSTAGDETKDWPKAQKQTIKKMTEKYGEPDSKTSSRVIWTEPKEPWEEITVYREAVEHKFPMEHKDFLEQAIFYKVPADKMDELAEYDGSIIVYRTEGRMAARCDKEAANYLALNLAHDIITDEKSVDEARQAYADAIEQMKAGETPEIMQELAFEPMSSDKAASPDQVVIGK